MPKIQWKCTLLFKLLILALIAEEALAGVLPSNASTKVRRAIDSGSSVNLKSKFIENDRDIAAAIASDESDESSSSSSSKPIEGTGAKVDVSGESESVTAAKTTKLLPSLTGNNNERTIKSAEQEQKSSGKLVLNRIESQRHEVLTESNDHKTKDRKRDGEMGDSEAESVEKSEEEKYSEKHVQIFSKQSKSHSKATQRSEEQEIQSSTRPEGVFSQIHTTPPNLLDWEILNTQHVANGLDEIVLHSHDADVGNVTLVDTKDEQSTTKEQILKDVEEVALKLTTSTTNHTLINVASAEEGMNNEKALNEENSKANGVSMGRAMDAAQSSENKLEAAFGRMAFNAKILKNITSMEKGIQGNQEKENKQKVEDHKNKDSVSKTATIESNIKQLEETHATMATEQKNAGAGVVIPTTPNSFTAQESTHQKLPSKPMKSLFPEKRAKFISENSTITENMNLPEGSVAWSLAGMKLIPTSDNDSVDIRWQANEILTTERTINISDYSEKNLLDWTKVMGMSGELEPMGTMEKNQLTDEVVKEKTDFTLDKPELEVSALASLDKDDVIKNKLSTTESIHQKPNGQTNSATTEIINDIDVMQTIKTTTPFNTSSSSSPFSSDSKLSNDKNDKHVDFGIDETSLNKSTFTPASTSSIKSYYSQQNVNAKQTGVTEQLSTTYEKSNITERPLSGDASLNLIATSTTPLATLEVTEVANTMSTVNKINLTTMPTTNMSSTITILTAALPVEHSTLTATITPAIATIPPKSKEATNRLDNNETTAASKKQFDTTTANTLLSSVDASVGSTNVNGEVYLSVTEQQQQHLSTREPDESVIETQTETEALEQNTLLTVSELTSSKAHGLLSADERILNGKTNASINVNAGVNANVSKSVGKKTDDGIIATQNESPSVATETTTTESTLIATQITTLLSTTSTTDLVDRNVSEAKISEVTNKEIPKTTEVNQIGNKVELEAHTTTTTSTNIKESISVVEVDGQPTDIKLGKNISSSAYEILEETLTTDSEQLTEPTTVKSALFINETLIPVNISTIIPTTSNTFEEATTTTPTQQQTKISVEPILYTSTTLKSDESTNVETTTIITLLNTTKATIEQEQTTGSTEVANDTTSSSVSTPVDFSHQHTTYTETQVEIKTKTTEGRTHDTDESSIETNVIDQAVDKKTTTKITDDTNESRTIISPTTETFPLEDSANPTKEKDIELKVTTQTVFDVNLEKTVPDVQDVANTTNPTTSTSSFYSTSTTMSNAVDATTEEIPKVNNTVNSTTTAEQPLINLLDDSTTSNSSISSTKPSIPYELSTISTSAVAVKPHEIYTLFSTTESIIPILTTTIDNIDATNSTTSTIMAISSNTSTANDIIPLVPNKTITSTSSTDFPEVIPTIRIPYIPTVVNTVTTVTTTMLPSTLHAAIGCSNDVDGSRSGTADIPTHLPNLINAGIHPNRNDGAETDVNVIIAITVSVIGVVALILLVAFLYLMRKRQKQMSYGQRCRPVSLDAYSLDNVSVLGSVRRKGALRASKRSYGNIAFDDPSLRHNMLTASELAKFVERRSSIFEEFRDVPQIIARANEIPADCEDKNRYANVIPLPETRVVLKQLGDDDKTEYINANYVRGPKDAPNYYIATQAPLETTVNDFWRMIWEQQSRVIIQATDLYENGIEKCAEYLPPSVTLDNHTTYGDFQITLKNREVKDKYAISTLMLKNTTENMCRELTHYWYKWPETGVPSEEAPIIAMLLEARSSLKGYVNESREKSSNITLNSDINGDLTSNGNGVTVISVEDVNEKTESGLVSGTANGGNGNVEINGNISPSDKFKGTTLRNQGPLTIHCSPGTGRTGTIIACDMAIRSLETPKRSVDIPQIVYYVRRGRASAVQTKEQYEFIYKVAHMYATKITNLSNDN